MITPLHPARRLVERFGRPTVIMVVSFVNSFAYTIVGLGIVYYLRDGFDATAGTIGLSSGLFSTLYFVGCFLFRPLTARILPRHSLVLSSLAAATVLGAVLVVTTVEAVVVLYGVAGLAMSLFWPPIMGWLSSGVEGQDLNRRIAHFNLSWSTGTVLGPLFAGVLSDVGIHLPVTVGLLLVATNVVIIVFASILVPAIKEDRFLEQRKRGSDSHKEGTPLRHPAWVGVVASYAVLGTILVVVPLHGRETLELATGVVGLLLLARGLSSTVSYSVLGRSSRWHFKPLFFWIPLVVLLVSAGSLGFLPSVATYIVVLPIVGIAVATSYTMSVFHGVAGSSDRTRRMAIHEALLTVGMVLGSTVGGVLYQYHRLIGAFAFCAGVIVIALAVQLVLLLRRHDRSRPARTR